jgi:hypothetical protein
VPFSADLVLNFWSINRGRSVYIGIRGGLEGSVESLEGELCEDGNGNGHGV